MAAAQSENIKRIAKDTLLLYIRMLFGMLVSLYTSRVILNTLGVEDYGVYKVEMKMAELGFMEILKKELTDMESYTGNWRTK